MCLELGPRCEAVFVGDYELGIAQGEAGRPDGGFGRTAPARVVFLNFFECLRIRDEMPAKDGSGLVLELFEIRARR